MRSSTDTLQQQEARALRQSATFVGAVLLSMLAMQQGLLIASYFGWLRVFAPLTKTHVGAMAFNMAVYVLNLAVPTLLVVLISRRRQNPFPSKRVGFGVLCGGVFGGMAVAIASNFLATWLMYVLSRFGVPEPQMPDRLEPTLFSLALNLLSTAVLPALVEEMVFRGYILGALRPHGDGIAVVLSAVLFGLFHGNVLQVPFALILGLALGYLVVLTDSIWPSVVLHFTNNAMSVLLSFFGKRYPEYQAAVNLVTFAAVAALGTVFLAMAYHGRLLKPIGNGMSTFRVRDRVSKLLSAPAMVLSIIVIAVTIGYSIGSGRA